MCLQYWPMGKFLFGNIEVETLETKSYAHFVIFKYKIILKSKFFYLHFNYYFFN